VLPFFCLALHSICVHVAQIPYSHNCALWFWKLVGCYGGSSLLVVLSSATTAVRGFSRMLLLLCHYAGVSLPPAVMWVVGAHWLPFVLCLSKPVSNQFIHLYLLDSQVACLSVVGPANQNVCIVLYVSNLADEKF
jgi:hypothetical protein